MKLHAQLERREAGGTYTFITLALSSLLLLSAGLLTGPSRSTLRAAASATRRASLREGAFSGALYAARTGASQPSVLLLEACEVKVQQPGRDAQGMLVVESEATNGVGEALRLRAHFSGAGELASFEFIAPATSAAAAPPPGAGGR